MLHKMFSIYDSAAECYLPPFVLPTAGMAVRVFTDCCKSEKHQFGVNPGDYTLFELGVFNDGNATVQALPSSVKVVNGLEVLGERDAEEQLSFELKEVGHETA